MAIEVALTIVIVAALLFALRCWLEVRRWSNLIARTRITIAYKRKVKLDPPLQEVALWANQLTDGENNRVIYLMGGTTVMIRKEAQPGPIVSRKAQRQTREGTWEAKDETSAPR